MGPCTPHTTSNGSLLFIFISFYLLNKKNSVHVCKTKPWGMEALEPQGLRLPSPVAHAWATGMWKVCTPNTAAK